MLSLTIPRLIPASLCAEASSLCNRLFSAAAAQPARAHDDLSREQYTHAQTTFPLAKVWRRLGQRLLLRPDGYKAVLVDAAGTLLVPSESTSDVYLRYAAKYMHQPLSKQEILLRFRKAYNTPWGESSLRYVGDGRPFWRFIVQESTGCHHPAMFEEVYDYYARAEAWKVAPGAKEALERLQAAGLSIAVVSNFDTRLRPLLADLSLDHLFDAVVVSAEVGYEKPNRRIFDTALELIGTDPSDAVHVGDDRRNDIWGARDAGIHAWLWGTDILSFDQLAYRVLHGNKLQQWDDDDDEEDHLLEVAGSAGNAAVTAHGNTSPGVATAGARPGASGSSSSNGTCTSTNKGHVIWTPDA